MDADVDGRLSGLELYFDASAIPSLLIDLGRRQIIRVNDAALALVGMPAEQVLGRPGRDFFTEVPDEQVPRARALRGERTVVRRQIRTSSGPRTVEMYMVPTGIGDVAFVQAIDLTETIEASTAARTQVEELQRTSAALSVIGSRLAHDLRTPLTVIAGFASLLRDEARDLTQDQIDGMLARIETSAHSLGSLTDMILQDAQVRGGEVAAHSFATADLFALVRGATAAQVDASGVDLRLTTDVDRLPVPVGSLIQPLLNLVSNAIKYADPDRPARIDVAVGALDDGVEVIVADNGLGLGDDPALLFAPGRRGASAEGTVGSGLGLSFVHAAIEGLGGEVVGENREEGGAIFRMTVPTASGSGQGRRSDATSLGAATVGRVLDASPVPAVVIDLEQRRIVRANDAMTALIGLPTESIVGRPGRDFLDDQAVADALRDAAMAVPGTFSSSSARVRTVRGVMPARVSLAAVPDSIFAVAQIVPEPAPDDRDTVSAAALAIASMAASAQARSDELGADGLRAALERIERIARHAG